MRERELLVGEPGTFGAKQHGGGTAIAHFEDAQRRVMHIERPEILVARPRCRGGDEATIGHRISHGIDQPCLLQDIASA
jgi:hypothetical protein